MRKIFATVYLLKNAYYETQEKIVLQKLYEINDGDFKGELKLIYEYLGINDAYSKSNNDFWNYRHLYKNQDFQKLTALL